MASAPTRMRPLRYQPDARGREYPRTYVGLETRNGLPPFRPYRWRGRPIGSCQGGPMPCQDCELARGCGGALTQNGGQ